MVNYRLKVECVLRCIWGFYIGVTCSENYINGAFFNLETPRVGLLTPRQPLDYHPLLCGVKRPAHGAPVLNANN
jgi:hypothetical protein